MGIDDLSRLESSVYEIKDMVDKATIILGDLLQDYSFTGDGPTKKEADKMSYEATRIVKFIDIALDYTFEAKTDLQKVISEINNSQTMRNIQNIGGKC